MENLRNTIAKVDIVLCANQSFDCCAQFEVTTVTDDAEIWNAIEAMYRKLEIQPKPPSAKIIFRDIFYDSLFLEEFDFDIFLSEPKDSETFSFRDIMA